MNSYTSPINNVGEYIIGFPEATQLLLEQLRMTIRDAVPEAEELISYQMPAYRHQGMLVYFAGYKKHIGFYPGASGIENFKKDIGGYKTSKGAIQFPLDQPLPLKLVIQIVKFRLKENLQKAREKAKNK
ncbi:MAG: DUF1801 domain-containing protein [Chitinophagaceae bacterium]